MALQVCSNIVQKLSEAPYLIPGLYKALSELVTLPMCYICWKVDKRFNLIIFSFPLLYSGQGHGGRSVIKTASVKSKTSQGPRLDKF